VNDDQASGKGTVLILIAILAMLIDEADEGLGFLGGPRVDVAQQAIKGERSSPCEVPRVLGGIWRYLIHPLTTLPPLSDAGERVFRPTLPGSREASLYREWQSDSEAPNDIAVPCRPLQREAGSAANAGRRSNTKASKAPMRSKIGSFVAQAACRASGVLSRCSALILAAWSPASRSSMSNFR
jgi:hypothetical protein